MYSVDIQGIHLKEGGVSVQHCGMDFNSASHHAQVRREYIDSQFPLTLNSNLHQIPYLLCSMRKREKDGKKERKRERERTKKDKKREGRK